MSLTLLQKELKMLNLSALFISSETQNPNIAYFTKTALTHSALLVPLKGKPKLYLSQLDYGKIKTKEFKIILLKKPLIKFIKNKKLCVDLVNLSAVTYKNLSKKYKLKDISGLMETIRSVKFENEIKLLHKAAEISDMAFRRTMQNFNYKTESEVKAKLEYELQKLGASPAFPTIVASGKNASIPHYTTSGSKLQKGFCVIDFGANYKGYCSDCTRTIYIGKPSKKEVSLYNFILKLQEEAIDKLKHDISCKELDNSVRTALGKYRKYFTHGLGHGVGLDVHEKPSISPKSRDVLKQNMVVTVEPGIYLKDKFGIRIEDTVLLSIEPRILTKIQKSLIVVTKK